jgi:alpha-amylase
MEYEVSLFDVPLLGRFVAISKMAGGDLRKIFKGSLVEQSPKHAVVSLHQDVKIISYL